MYVCMCVCMYMCVDMCMCMHVCLCVKTRIGNAELFDLLSSKTNQCSKSFLERDNGIVRKIHLH